MTRLAPISGRELSDFVNSAEFTKLSNDYVAPTPGSALRRIETRLGVKPTAGGQNVAEMVELRDILASAAESIAVLHALMITAPHTHWKPGLPVIMAKKDDIYVIGFEEPSEREIFIPISFALTPRGPFPYEWAHQSIGFSIDELRQTWALVEKACAIAGGKNWPLGLSLAFRFKSLFEPFSTPAVEYTPEDGEDPIPTESIILRKEDLETMVPGVSSAQVGWHAFSDSAAGLSDEGKSALLRLRGLTLKMSLEQKRELANRLSARASQST